MYATAKEHDAPSLIELVEAVVLMAKIGSVRATAALEPGSAVH